MFYYVKKNVVFIICTKKSIKNVNNVSPCPKKVGPYMTNPTSDIGWIADAFVRNRCIVMAKRGLMQGQKYLGVGSLIRFAQGRGLYK